MSEKRVEYKLNLGGCFFGHTNDLLKRFLEEHPQPVMVKYPGKAARLTGPKFSLAT